MPVRTDRDMIRRTRESRSRQTSYPRYNLQSGDKAKYDFFVNLMPRLIKSKVGIQEPFFEYFQHFGCGPDGDQSFTCLNETREDKKTNAKKCPQCAECRKILRNQDEYKEHEIDVAKRKMARDRVNWPVYDLDRRKIVEMLEISGQALDDILDEFGEDEDYEDLTDLASDAALKIHRKGIGQNCSYKRKAVFDKKYKLDREDLTNIKDSYFTPESVVEKKTREEIIQIVTGEFEVETRDVEEKNPRRSEEPDRDISVDELENISSDGRQERESKRESRKNESEEDKSQRRSRKKSEEEPEERSSRRRRSQEEEPEERSSHRRRSQEEEPEEKSSRRRRNQEEEPEERSSRRRKSSKDEDVPSGRSEESPNIDSDDLMAELEAATK